MNTVDKIKQSPGIAAVALALVLIATATVTFAGMRASESSEAAPPVRLVSNINATDTLFMSPNGGRVAVGTKIPVTVYANSSTNPVNVVQFQVNYPAATLKLDSVSNATAFPVVAATDTATPGIVRVARTITSENPPVTGKNPIATLNFTVISKSQSTIGLNFEPSSSFLMRSTDNANIMTTISGASFSIK